MTIYVLGDIQGCYSPLQKLLEKINFNPTQDTLWCTGDLVNRGPQSLEVLRFFKSLGSKHRIVLGNHDLHLLAVAHGARAQHTSDTLTAIFAAPDRDELLMWLRQQPLLVHEAGYVMTHAGLAPMWTVVQAQAYAHEVETVLRDSNPEIFFKNMYGNTPERWEDNLTGVERLRCIVNYFTRMRFCYPDGGLNLTYKGDVEHKPADVLPWFEVTPRANTESKIIFGHWAALAGKATVPNVYALDTGCVWGDCLTAMSLPDERRYQVGCG